MTKTAPQKKSRIAQLFLPKSLKNNAFVSDALPDDRWILHTVWDIFKTNKALHKTLRGIATFTVTALASVAIGVSGLFVAMPLAMTAGLGGIGLIGTIASAFKLGSRWKVARKETLPKLQGDIAARYLLEQGHKTLNAWKERAAANKLAAAPKLSDEMKKAQDNTPPAPPAPPPASPAPPAP